MELTIHVDKFKNCIHEILNQGCYYEILIYTIYFVGMLTTKTYTNWLIGFILAVMFIFHTKVLTNSWEN